MKSQNSIIFRSQSVKNKPNSLLNKTQEDCPFCNFERLKEDGLLIKESGKMLWVKNKYPVLEDVQQTLIIETNSCEENFSNYSLQYATQVFQFVLDCRKELKDTGLFEEIITLKNHGLESNSSVRHAHIQICGMNHQSYNYRAFEESFKGPAAYEDLDLAVTVSEVPTSEFYEFNIIWDKKNVLEKSIFWLQTIIQFLPHFKNGYESYNLAFHESEQSYALKIIPRKHASSVFLLGFGMKQIPDDAQAVALELKKFALRK